MCVMRLPGDEAESDFCCEKELVRSPWGRRPGWDFVSFHNRLLIQELKQSQAGCLDKISWWGKIPHQLLGW